MAGFPFQHFSPNIKCIVISLIVILFYWQIGVSKANDPLRGLLPVKSIPMVIFLLWVTYISVAWYDYLYDVPADRRMKPTLFPLGRIVFMPFKDPQYQETYEKMSPEDKAAMDTFDKFVVYGVLGLGAIILYYKFKL